MHCKLYPAHTWVIAARGSVHDYSTSHLHISEEVSAMLCGWCFLFTRRDLGNTYPHHRMMFLFCHGNREGTVVLAERRTVVVYILGLGFLISDASLPPQLGTFPWTWKINSLHPANKSLLNTYFQFLSREYRNHRTQGATIEATQLIIDCKLLINKVYVNIKDILKHKQMTMTHENPI